uniref:restriction endonuclease subunit S n=1 Tax=Algoriphagus sp. TaxID=1872435 RepID=UPI0040476C88
MSNWKKRPIKDVVIDLHQGLNTAGYKIKFYETGYPIIQTRNLEDGIIDLDDKIKFMSRQDWLKYKDKYKPNIGDVFLTNIGTIGKTAVVTEEQDYLIHWNIFIFKIDKNVINPFYLKTFLDTPFCFDYYLSCQKGGTVNFITKKMIEVLEIPLPPLSEQQRIVAILDEAFAAIAKAKANAEQNLKNAKELFESYLQGVFENKGEGWEKKRLGEVCEKITRGISPKYIEKNGTLVLNQKCVRDHKINFDLARLHDENIKSISIDKFLRVGDVLVNSTGEGTLGRVAQVRDLPEEKVTVDSHVSIVRPIANQFYLDFFGWAMVYIESEIEESGAGASGQTELARTVLEYNFSIAYPKSHTEQQSIVRQLDALRTETQRLEAVYQQKLADLEELKKSILQKAFAGELTDKSIAS